MVNTIYRIRRAFLISFPNRSILRTIKRNPKDMMVFMTKLPEVLHTIITCGVKLNTGTKNEPKDFFVV